MFEQAIQASKSLSEAGALAIVLFLLALSLFALRALFKLLIQSMTDRAKDAQEQTKALDKASNNIATLTVTVDRLIDQIGEFKVEFISWRGRS